AVAVAVAAVAAVAAAVAAVAVAVAVDLDLRGPSGAAEAADKTRRAPHRDVRRFPRGQDALSENPAGSADPVRSTGRAGGVCFFAPGFFAQAKKGGSRRHGAKALDLDVGERAAGQDPPYEALAEQQAGQDPPYEAAVAVSPTREDQGQLAALAPSSGASRHLRFRGGRLFSRKREKGCS